MKWISLIFATVTMAAVGWLVWKATLLQERRAAEREARRTAEGEAASPRLEVRVERPTASERPDDDPREQ